MKLNRRRGATLGLVAVAVLVIIVLGVGFFILSQILGGGREVANATDAGVLNVARRALSPTLIQVTLPGDSDTSPYNDFLGAAINAGGVANSTTNVNDGMSNKISMLAVNRVIAQSILVALNAEECQTTTSSQHAHDVVTAAKQVSRLIKQMVEGTTLNQQFTVVAQSNNTKMFQGNKVQLTGLQSAFLRPGNSTNVYVSPNLTSSVATSLPNNFKNSNANALTHDGLAGQDKYVAGYTMFDVPAGLSGHVAIAGVPIFPKQKPHLVDTGEYNGAGANPTDYLPPNAFRANSRTQDNNSGGFGGAVSCALVGALDQDFPAAITRGYVRIKNGIDAATDPALNSIVTSPVVDAGTDVFNNELWSPNGGVDVSNNGVFALKTGAGGAANPNYGAAQGYINAWKNHNQTDPGNAATEPPYPPAAGAPSSAVMSAINILQNTPAGYTTNPPKSDFLAIGSEQNCDQTNYFTQNAGDPDVCHSGGWGPATQGSLVFAIMNLNGAGPGTGGGAGGNGYSAIEIQKHELLSHRFSSGKCSSVGSVVGTAPGMGGKAYGMKQFTVGNCYNTPNVPVNFGAIGSPLALLNQIGSSATADPRKPAGPANGNTCHNDVINKILLRMRQVDPTLLDQQIRDALASAPLPLNKTLYLYSPGPGLVNLVDGVPGTDYFQADLTADGGPTGPAMETCQNEYNLENKIVDASKDAGCPIGDAGFHLKPYMEYSGTPLDGVDRAVWTPASGWRNLLGEVQFQNEATGAGTFCKPN